LIYALKKFFDTNYNVNVLNIKNRMSKDLIQNIYKDYSGQQKKIIRFFRRWKVESYFYKLL